MCRNKMKICKYLKNRVLAIDLIVFVTDTLYSGPNFKHIMRRSELTFHLCPWMKHHKCITQITSVDVGINFGCQY
jgi:hypothetical protein